MRGPRKILWYLAGFTFAGFSSILGCGGADGGTAASPDAGGNADGGAAVGGGGSAAVGGSTGETASGGTTNAGETASGGSTANAGSSAKGGSMANGGSSPGGSSAAGSPAGGNSVGGNPVGGMAGGGGTTGARSCDRDCTALANTQCAGANFSQEKCVADCETAFQDAVAEAAKIGCLEEFLALDACRAGDPVCTHPNPSQCVPENNAYIQCLTNAP